MSDLPEWAVKHKVFCDQCSDNCLLFQALSIAWEAMGNIRHCECEAKEVKELVHMCDGKKASESKKVMDTIRKLGEE